VGSSAALLWAISMTFAMRLAVFYGAIFLVIGSFLPFFPVWLDAQNLSAGEIGVILASPLFVRILVTPVVAFAADRNGDRRRFVIALASGASLASLLYIPSPSFWTILAVTIAFALFWVSIMPLTETIAMSGVRLEGLDYGRMRLWGSLSFIGVSMLGGAAIERAGPNAALAMFITAVAFVVVAAFALPKPTGKGHLKAAIDQPRVRIVDALALLKSPLFLLLLLTTSMVQGSHAFYYAFATLHWRSIGIPAITIGQLWAVGVVAEIALFLISRRIVVAVGAARLIAVAAIAAVVRWTIMAFDPPLEILTPVQLLHGLTFGAAHLGALHFISQAIPEDRAATAQGLYAAVTAGIAMGTGMLVAGPIYAQMGGRGYLVMAGVAGISTLAAWLLCVCWHGEPILRAAARP